MLLSIVVLFFHDRTKVVKLDKKKKRFLWLAVFMPHNYKNGQHNYTFC